MAEITFENVKPLLANAQQNGATMQCTFRCPTSGATVEASASIKKGRGLGDVAKQSAKRSLMWSVRSGVMRAVRSVLGYGFFGRVGRDIANQLLGDAAKKADQAYSDDEKNAAIVDAFTNVSSQFVWDGKKGRWVSAKGAGDVLTDFAKQLSQAPVTEKYDRVVLARILVEIANADGRLADEEKELLKSFITPDLGSFEDLSAKSPLSGAELAETSASARETMLMLGWAVALSDEDLASEEQARLVEVANGLQLDEGRAAQMKQHAQLYLLDQALESAYANGASDAGRQEVMGLAQKLGIDGEAAERAEIRYRKRNGLV